MPSTVEISYFHDVVKDNLRDLLITPMLSYWIGAPCPPQYLSQGATPTQAHSWQCPFAYDGVLRVLIHFTGTTHVGGFTFSSPIAALLPYRLQRALRAVTRSGLSPLPMLCLLKLCSTLSHREHEPSSCTGFINHQSRMSVGNNARNGCKSWAVFGENRQFFRYR